LVNWLINQIFLIDRLPVKKMFQLNALMIMSLTCFLFLSIVIGDVWSVCEAGPDLDIGPRSWPHACALGYVRAWSYRPRFGRTTILNQWLRTYQLKKLRQILYRIICRITFRRSSETHWNNVLVLVLVLWTIFFHQRIKTLLCVQLNVYQSHDVIIIIIIIIIINWCDACHCR